jgi:hypothetical protein
MVKKLAAKKRAWRGTAALVGGMILLVTFNHFLLDNRQELWRMDSGAEEGVPSLETVRRWDAFRLLLGGVLFPMAGGGMLWLLVRGRPLKAWGSGTLALFVVGLATLYFHLTWIYEWGSERYVVMPIPLVRTFTFLSLNALALLSLVGLVVIVMWVNSRRARNQPAHE